MNDAILNELRVVVERAVRPVRATMSRKRKMREELLSHLVSIFQEEMLLAGDAPTALEHAKQRFGDVRELSEQIKGSIPRREWFSCFTERILLFRKDESVLAHSARVAVSAFVWFATMSVLLPLVLLLRGRQYELLRLEITFIAAGIVFAGLFFVMILLGHSLQRALFSKGSSRSCLTASLYALLSAPVVPVFGFMLTWIATGDLALGYVHFQSLLWSIVVVPAILVAAVREIAGDTQQDTDWVCLETAE